MDFLLLISESHTRRYAIRAGFGHSLWEKSHMENHTKCISTWYSDQDQIQDWGGSKIEKQMPGAFEIKGPWASIGPLSFCFIEVMHNEFWKFLSSILSFLTFEEKLHAEIFGQHFNTTNQ